MTCLKLNCFSAGCSPVLAACPDGGWWPENAMPYLLQKGLSEEAAFLTKIVILHAIPGSDRDKQAIKIKKHVAIFDINQRKDYLSKIGPMIGCFDVYRDFMSYSNGIYSHVAGELLGGHCVEIIGYDDNEGCWICKNSWNVGWGESGFFKIAYGECNLDSENPYWGSNGYLQRPQVDNNVIELGLLTTIVELNVLLLPNILLFFK